MFDVGLHRYGSEWVDDAGLSAIGRKQKARLATLRRWQEGEGAGADAMRVEAKEEKGDSEGSPRYDVEKDPRILQVMRDWEMGAR